MTDAEKEYGRLLKKVMDAGLLRRRAPRIEPLRLLALQDHFPNFAGPIRFLADRQPAHACAGCPSSRRRCCSRARPMSARPVSRRRWPRCSPGIRKCKHGVAELRIHSGRHGPRLVIGAARHGVTALMHNSSLAPVILLDEIDKANDDTRSSPPGTTVRLARAAHGVRVPRRIRRISGQCQLCRLAHHRQRCSRPARPVAEPLQGVRDPRFQPMSS